MTKKYATHILYSDNGKDWIMGRHEGYRRVRPVLRICGLVLFAGLIGIGGLAMLPDSPSSQPTVPAFVPSAIPFTPPAPTPSVGHEHEVAMATPAGQVAQSHSDQVTHDRQVAAGDLVAGATQQQIDQAMGGPVMFGPDSASLTPEGEAQVGRIVDVLRVNPSARVEVVGHTAVEISDPPLCLQLSQLRAEQVAIRVEAAGVDPNRVSAIGVSHTQAKDTASESRRAEVVVLSG